MSISSSTLLNRRGRKRRFAAFILSLVTFAGLLGAAPASATDIISLTYDPNGATTGASIRFTYESPATVDLLPNVDTWSKTGYSQSGWRTTPTGGTSYSPGDSFGPFSESTTIYAKWVAKRYTFTFDLNTGTGTVGDLSGDFDGTVTLPSKSSASKTGYTLLGWTTVLNGGTFYAEGSSLPVNSTTVSDVTDTSKKRTLYAKWGKNYLVSYDDNDGTGSPHETIATCTYYGADPCTIAVNTFVYRNDSDVADARKVFIGWNTSKTGVGGVAYQPGDLYSESADLLLYAQWATRYSITYKSGSAPGGDISGTLDRYLDGSGTPYIVKENTYVYDGYVFAGWLGSDEALYSPGAQFERPYDLTLTAQWKRTYQIKYYANTGFGTTMQDGYYTTGGSNYAIVGSTYYRPGYAFKNWNTEADGSGKTVVPGDTYLGVMDKLGDDDGLFDDTKTNLSLFAQWVPAYTVTYNLGGATGTISSGTFRPDIDTSYTVASGSSLTKSGFAFLGWTISADGSGSVYKNPDTIVPTSDLTLYAKWAAAYPITYNANLGTGSVAAGTYVVGSATTIAAGTGLTRTGYVFAGWNTSADGTGTSYAVGAAYSTAAPLTLYAKWAVAYTITFNANGGVGSVPEDGVYGVGLASYEMPANPGLLVRVGYIFDGWSTSATYGSGTKYTPGTGYTFAANTTLYAAWKPAAFTIKYNGNSATSGSLPVDGSFTTGGTAYVILGNTGSLARSGYTFGGWTKEANGSGTVYQAGDTYSMSADVTFYAKWIIAPFSISFNGNGSTGGTLPVAGSISATNTPYTVPANTGSLVRAGYSFDGWNTAADGTGTNYAPGSSYATLASITLYAKWAPGRFTVDYNGNGATGGLAPIGTSYTTAATPFVAASNYGLLERAGFAFAGWNTAADGKGTNVPAGGEFRPTANTILYAKWTAVVVGKTLRVNFSRGSSTLSASAKVALTTLATYATSNNLKEVAVTGYMQKSDASKASTRSRLAAARAIRVYQYLLTLDPSLKIKTVSNGTSSKGSYAIIVLKGGAGS